MKKHKNQNCGQKKIVFSGPKENEARKDFRKAMRAFRRVDFALAHQKRSQAVIITHTKVRARIKKLKARKVPIHIQDFQPLKIRLRRDNAIPGNRAIGIPIALTILQRLRGTIQDTLHGWYQFLWILPTIRRTLFLNLGCTRSIGSRTAIRRFQKYALYHSIKTEFCPATSPFCLPTLKQKRVGKVVLFIFPTTPPCSTRVDVLETGGVPILFSLPQMKNLGMTIELDPQGDKIACPAFGLHPSPVE